MNNKIFIIDIDEFYIMLSIIFWFIGCLFLWNYPIIALFLYTFGLIFVIYAFDEMLNKEWRGGK